MQQKRHGWVTFQSLSLVHRDDLLLMAVYRAVEHFEAQTGRQPTHLACGSDDLTRLYVEHGADPRLASISTWTTWDALDGLGVWVGCLTDDEIRGYEAYTNQPLPPLPAQLTVEEGDRP